MFYLSYFLLCSRFDWTRRYFLRRRQNWQLLCPQQQHVILLTKDQLTFFWLRWADSELGVGVVLWTRKAVCKWITAWFICTWRQWYLWQYPDVKYKGGLQRWGFPCLLAFPFANAAWLIFEALWFWNNFWFITSFHIWFKMVPNVLIYKKSGESDILNAKGN